MKIVALAVAAISFILAALYFTGHGPLASPHKVHVSHGVLFVAIALASLVWYRLQSAPPTNAS